MIGRRTFAQVVAGTLTVSCALFGVAPVGAASTPNVTAVDVQDLPRHYGETSRARELVAASPDYVLHNVRDLPSSDGQGHHTVVRTADGETVWSTFRASVDASKVTLAGRYFVEQVGEATYWPTTLRFFDVETRALVGEIPLRSRETLGGIGPGWIITSRADADLRGGHHVVLHRLDGTSAEFPELDASNIPRYVGTDGAYAWVKSQFNDTLTQIDITAGTSTVITAPPGGWSEVFVGPTHVFDVRDQYNGHSTVTAIHRTTDVRATHDVVIGIDGNGGRFVTLGNGLGVWNPYRDTRSALWELDLVKGERGAVVADRLSDVRQAGPGVVAMIDAARVPGTIRVADGPAPRRVTDLPRVAEGASSIAYDRVLHITWGDDTTWMIDPDEPSTGWMRTDRPLTRMLSSSGDVTLEPGYGPDGFPSTTWRLSWPTGSRIVESPGVELGHGGELVVRMLDGYNAGYVVERVRTGEVVARADHTGAVADGTWVWRWTAPGVLTGTDVDRPGVGRRVTVPGREFAIADVRGRWAMIFNPGLTVVDTLDAASPIPFPGSGGGAPEPARLGAGFVVSTTWTRDAQNRNDGIRTRVTDLSPPHEARDLVDPRSGKSVTSYVVDEAGSPSLAFIDAGGLPKVVHLPWLREAPLARPDVQPPVLTGATGSSGLVASSVPVRVRGSWTYTDQRTAASGATGVASYDVRWRARTVPRAFSAWSTATSTSGATIDRTIKAGQELCAQARATDATGNTSAWSDQRCTQVDGTPPRLAAATGSPRFLVSDPDDGVRYHYRASDDVAVASYDVHVRSAASSRALGPWKALRSRTTATRLEQEVGAGGEWCFRFRARDKAGNVSAWSPARCTSIAIQDATFHGPVDSLRERSRFASDGWYTSLNHPGAWLRLRSPQVGRTVAVWAITGPKQGTADVYVGKTRVGRLSTQTKTPGRRLVTFPMRRNGTVKIIQRSARSVGVDAIAVAR